VSKKKDPVNVITEYFETASASEVSVMRSVITGIVKRRFDDQKPARKKPGPKPTPQPVVGQTALN